MDFCPGFSFNVVGTKVYYLLYLFMGDSHVFPH